LLVSILEEYFTGRGSVIDTENVLSRGFGFQDFLDHAGKIGNVDSGDKVFIFTTNGESSGVLEPRFFKVTVKDGFSFSIKNTSRDNISSNSRSLSSKNKVFYLLDSFILLTSLSIFIIGFSKSMV
jgi:hypothetical protein